MINLPQAFAERTKKLLGDEHPLFEQALNEPPSLSVRANDKMIYSPSDERVSWCKSGFYLRERPLFTADPFFHAGVYYVQEASSMFLAEIVKQFFPDAERVLDLCAAPGGKSTLLSQTLSEKSLLVSNEIIRQRANILAENMIKWGNPNIVVTNNKPADFAVLSGFFDAVVVDAPCSGEGMFRKDAQAIAEWSEQNVEMCARRQREILSDVWNALKTNGILVYSTCTYNREENEENVRWICEELDAEFLKVDLKGNNEITESESGYRFYPHKTRGEGFFIAVLRKKQEMNFFKKPKKELSKKPTTLHKENLPFRLKNQNDYLILQENDKIKAYPADKKDDFVLLNNTLKVIHSGICLGEVKGRDFIPDISVALSKSLDLGSVNEVDVDYQTAISYLKRENIFLENEKKGYLLVTYKNQPLGWVKNLGNRCNNLYPQEWRIRMNL
jgi:NOL1/NOP2/sun family putative RNA methylase